MGFDIYHIKNWNYINIAGGRDNGTAFTNAKRDYYTSLSSILSAICKTFNNIIKEFSFNNDIEKGYSILENYTNQTSEDISKVIFGMMVNPNYDSLYIYAESEFSGKNNFYYFNSGVSSGNNIYYIGPGQYGVNGNIQEINTISDIMVTSNCIAFTFRNATNYKSIVSKNQVILARTKKGHWAIITPIRTPFKQKEWKMDQTISDQIKISYKNNIVCFSPQTTDSTLTFDFTPADLGKQSSIMSFDPIPVLGTDDYVLGCYFNFYSNITSPGYIVVDDKKFYYNGWLSIEE